MNTGLGPHRLLRDRGAWLAVVVLAGIMGLAALDLASTSRSREQADRRPVMDVRVTCRDRNARDARITLAGPLSLPPARAGRVWDSQVATLTGRVELHLPFPTPPDFAAHLLVGAPGCVGERIAVDAASRPGTLVLTPAATPAGPWDLREPPDTNMLAAVPSEEHVARLRAAGTFAANRLYLLDGPPVSCGACHNASAAEHRQAHGAPPSPAVRALARGAGPAASTCAACHAPTLALAAQDGLAVLGDTAAFSCSACHRVDPSRVPPGLGLGPHNTVLDAPGDRRALATGARGDTTSPVMAVVHAPALRSDALCLACHAQRRGALNLDPTAQEHTAWKQGAADRADTTCVTCHMRPSQDAALVDGPAYAMWGVDHPQQPRKRHGDGGTAAQRLANAVGLTARWEGNTLVVGAENRGASHALPGAWPRRALVVELVDGAAPVSGPRDAQGRPRVELRRVLANGAGVCATPWEATAVAADTRLLPGSPVEWRWTFPAPQRVTVVLRLERVCGDAPADEGELVRRVEDVRPARVDD